MSYNATTLSTTSSLSSSIVDDTSHPSSTRPEAGWGSPSPAPDSFPPISLATIPTPIHSVTIPLYAHMLCDDFPDTCDIKKLSVYLRSPAFASSIDSFLDIGSPLYALQCAYLKNSHLRLMSTNISPSPQQTILSCLIREVYLEIEGSLVMAMYQLGMLEFLEDICYSSSPLSWYLSLFCLTSHSYALWYVFLRLDTYSDSFEFFELFFY